ncbi:helix-turn-helix domain-containing protein [Neobacillus kokaensis]|uniref:HTH araC/xylS-type domain-containing protein n=1 Tax=Neobacillus kokaensis TaxID=2759023 RepID=A0ABQ3N7E2_9BACI|nr:helix-turn-helix domain-containing protein [Neobacillus kokaensis]GHI00866.1 hypothetical protein AM1BK_44080 [Neobacillus kokaensis]
MRKKILFVSEDQVFLEQTKNVNDLLRSPFLIEKVSPANPELLFKLDCKDSIIVFDVDHETEEDQTTLLEKIKENQLQYAIMVKRHFRIEEVRRFFKGGVFDCIEKMVGEKELYRTFLELLKIKANHQDRDLIKSFGSNDQLKNDVKMSLAYDLVFGNVKHSKQIWDRSHYAGLSVIPNTCMIACIDDYHRQMKNKSKLWGQSIRDQLIESIQQYFELNQAEEMMTINNGPEKVVLLLALQLQSNMENYKAAAISHAKGLQRFIKEKTGLSITIGIGNYYEDARNFHLSYEEALRALAKKFFTGNHSVIHIVDVEPSSNKIDLLEINEMAVIANQLAVGDCDGVKNSLFTVTGIFSAQKNISPRLFKLQTLDLLSSLSRAAINGGAQYREVFTIQFQYAKELLNLENVEQICDWFQEVVHLFLEQVLNNHNEKMLKSVQQALTYINNHFREEITLESVANEVHLSPNYFSNIFKKTTGSSFIEYLTNLRIDKAKLLLMDLNCTIYQVASEVGYSTSRYFSRVFKSNTGMTPSEFRNSLLVTNVSDSLLSS